MKVLIRADASQSIGSGHVARCLTLAHCLRKQGAQVTFASLTLPGHRLVNLAAQGMGTFAMRPGPGSNDIEALLPWQADIDALKGAGRFDWVIVDHYGLDARWETAARAIAARVMAIDDLANREHSADVLLDQNLTASAEAYAGLLAPGCKTFFGPRHALLAPAFEALRVSIRPRVQRVLVNFGGFDPNGHTLKAMAALDGVAGLEVDFIAGLGNPDWAHLQAYAATRPNWTLHGFVEDFPALMATADLFVGAGGGTTWERAAMGLPTLCVAVAHNQQANAELMALAGAHVYVGEAAELSSQALRQAVIGLLDDAERRQALANQSRQLVDGLGALRVAWALFAAAPSQG
ncbi:N-Acetylneuraminate cytidylyltransferase [Pseudomonas sp. M47T1]|uniref:UDP-2,4-diacetamido-2,4, 6-trideoxy-beta-L-altropyranose hydrolase n=1 Tax=unclassified Pseudomonas TaxID=196821 RepID=UPI0002608649|nr:UDP-2,4-diacetamido-2,4,6-trideoxy-beta-L-altropyranose hydrolase [Pseudomonas sp. M47T1]EIK93539.1 N-Acetylneuraminate cytidylyltransferase [Pseudomonas sp. M47T1]